MTTKQEEWEGFIVNIIAGLAIIFLTLFCIWLAITKQDQRFYLPFIPFILISLFLGHNISTWIELRKERLAREAKEQNKK